MRDPIKLEAFFKSIRGIAEEAETFEDFEIIVKEAFSPESIGMTQDEFDSTISKIGENLS